MSEEATNSDAGEDVRVDAAPEVDEVAAQSDISTDQTEDLGEGAGDGQPADQVEDDTEEVEHEGQKYKVPKAVKPLLLMQADYTRKTQAIAERDRALAERESVVTQQAEVATALRAEIGKVETLRSQLGAFEGIDWAAARAATRDIADPNERQLARDQVDDAYFQFQTIAKAVTDAEAVLTTKEQEFRLQSERAVATAMQDTVQILAKDIPNWGEKTVQAIVQTGADYGFTMDDFKVMTDPRAWKAFNELARLRADNAKMNALLGRATTTERHAASQTTQPAKAISAKGGGFKPGLDDNLPVEEWNRRRAAQVRARRQAR